MQQARGAQTLNFRVQVNSGAVDAFFSSRVGLAKPRRAIIRFAVPTLQHPWQHNFNENSNLVI
jgi:hypothetical protein